MTALHTPSLDHVTSLARRALERYRLANLPETLPSHVKITPTIRRTAEQQLRGICYALDSLGFAMTDTKAYMDVLDTFRESGPRPYYNASNNTAQQAYDTAQADDLVRRWMA